MRIRRNLTRRFPSRIRSVSWAFNIGRSDAFFQTLADDEDIDLWSGWLFSTRNSLEQSYQRQHRMVSEW